MKDRARLKRVKQYYALYEQIYKTPTMSLYDLARTTKLSRNSVSKYLKKMYEYQILKGPHLAMKSGSNYTEYMYLMKFTDPQKVFKGLKGFPHVVYYTMAFGDWKAALDALGKIATPQDKEIIIKMLHDKSPDVRKAALDVLYLL